MMICIWGLRKRRYVVWRHLVENQISHEKFWYSIVPLFQKKNAVHRSQAMSGAFCMPGFCRQGYQLVGQAVPEIELPNTVDSLVKLSRPGQGCADRFLLGWCAPCRASNLTYEIVR